MPDRDWAKDYVAVNERIIAFKKDHPEGSLQSTIISLTESSVVVRGEAYRTPNDERPGIGHSSLAIPGTTPYTRGSELENAETSAWGRALAALGYEVKKSVASAEEVEAKQPAQNAPGRPRPVPVAPIATPAVDEAPWPEEMAPPLTPAEALRPAEWAVEAAAEIFDVRPIDTRCAIHQVDWRGEPGDRYHRTSDGKYCRAPDNTPKVRAAR